MQGLSRRVDTFSTLLPMRSVKWCRERRMTVLGPSYNGWSGGTCLSRLNNTTKQRDG